MKIFGVRVKALIAQAFRICIYFSTFMLFRSIGTEIVGLLMSERSLTPRRVLVIAIVTLVSFVICIPIALIVGWIKLKLKEYDEDSTNTTNTP